MNHMIIKQVRTLIKKNTGSYCLFYNLNCEDKSNGDDPSFIISRASSYNPTNIVK